MRRPEQIGRYLLFDTIASGGMASVHLGRVVGDAGFSKIVAIKRHHPQFAKDPYFRDMLLDEARLTARVVHPNVISVLDVIAAAGELLVVMEYVSALSFSQLGSAWSAKGQGVPPPVAVAVLVGALEGLHAAHEAVDERGKALKLVHRDVSPHNFLVGEDGLVRVIDFGVAQAAERIQVTHTGEVKGKLAYMAAEQIRRTDIDRRADIYGAGVTLWEALAGRRIHDNVEPGKVVQRVTGGDFEPPSRYARDPVAALDDVVMRALSADPKERYPTAQEMTKAVREATTPASRGEVSDWIARVGGDALGERKRAYALVDAWTPAVQVVAVPAVQIASEPTEARSGSASDSTEVRPTSSADATEARSALGPTEARPTLDADATESRERGERGAPLDRTLVSAQDPLPPPRSDPDGTRTIELRQSDETRTAELREADETQTKPLTDPDGTRTTELRAGHEPNAVPAASVDQQGTPERRASIAPAGPPGGSVWSAVLGAAGVIALVAVVALVILYARQSEAPRAPSEEPGEVVVVPGDSVPTVASAQAAWSQPSAEEVPVASAAPESSQPISSMTPSAAPPPTTQPPAPRPPAPRPPSGRPKPNCNPPYTLDADGVRIPKRECY